MSAALFGFFAACMLLGASLLWGAPERLHTQPDVHFSRSQAPHTGFHGLLALGMCMVPDDDPLKALCAALWVGLNLAIAGEAWRSPVHYRRPRLVIYSHLGLAAAFLLWLLGRVLS